MSLVETARETLESKIQEGRTILSQMEQSYSILAEGSEVPTTPVKRGRGRPKGSGVKKPAYDGPKRPRGRPRKNPLPTTNQTPEVTPENVTV